MISKEHCEVVWSDKGGSVSACIEQKQKNAQEDLSDFNRINVMIIKKAMNTLSSVQQVLRRNSP